MVLNQKRKMEIPFSQQLSRINNGPFSGFPARFPASPAWPGRVLCKETRRDREENRCRRKRGSGSDLAGKRRPAGGERSPEAPARLLAAGERAAPVPPEGAAAAGQPPSVSRRPEGKGRSPAASGALGADGSRGSPRRRGERGRLRGPPDTATAVRDSGGSLPSSPRFAWGGAERETSLLLHWHSGSTWLFRYGRQIAPPPAAQQAPCEVGRVGHAQPPPSGIGRREPREGPGFSGSGLSLAGRQRSPRPAKPRLLPQTQRQTREQRRRAARFPPPPGRLLPGGRAEGRRGSERDQAGRPRPARRRAGWGRPSPLALRGPRQPLPGTERLEGAGGRRGAQPHGPRGATRKGRPPPQPRPGAARL